MSRWSEPGIRDVHRQNARTTSPPGASREPWELDRRAAVDDDVEAGLPGAVRRGVRVDPELEPHGLGADLERLVDVVPGERGPPEDVDHLDALLGRDAVEVRVAALAEHLVGVRVHRDDAVAVALQ